MCQTRAVAFFMALAIVGLGTSSSVGAGPVITDFSPRKGRPGTRVIMAGIGLQTVTALRFGKALADFEVVNEKELHATVPEDAATGPLKIESAFGLWQTVIPFVAPPRIDSFSPERGWAGTIVTIDGINFLDSKSVAFGGVPARFEITAPTQIRAIVPLGFQEGPITVSGVLETGTSQTFTAAGPGPVVDDLSVWIGAPGDRISIRGVNFSGASAVLFNGAASAFEVAADTQINVTVPTATNGPLTVVSPRGVGKTEQLFIITHLPVVTGFSPNVAAPRMPVKVQGVNFRQISSVWVGSIQAAGHSVPAPNQLTFNVPLAAESGNISVSNLFGVGLSTDTLTVTSAPVVSDIQPRIIQPGQQATIYGANFFNASSVHVGAMPALFAVPAPTQIRFVVPAGAKTGFVLVSNPFGKGVSQAELVVTGAGPHVSDFWPQTGARGRGVTIFGVHLDQTIGVVFNSESAAKFSVPSPTQLKVRVSAEATSGPIKLLSVLGDHETGATFFLPPRLKEIEPATAVAGTEVSLRGESFIGASRLLVNGMEHAFQALSNPLVRFMVTPETRGGAIELIAPAGRVISTNELRVLPRVDHFEPTLGYIGTPVTITGTSFFDVESVAFGGTAAEFEAGSSSRIVVSVPVAGQSGLISVTTAEETGTSTMPFTVTTASDLQLQVSIATNRFRLDQSVTIECLVTNAGPSIATFAGVTNQLPDGVFLLSSEPEPSPNHSGDGRLVWPLGVFTNRAAAKFHLTLMPQRKGVFSNIIWVAAREPDLNEFNNRAETKFVVMEPSDLDLRIRHDPFSDTITLSWPLTGVPVALETSSWLPGTNWRSIPFEPATTNNRRQVTFKQFSFQAWFRLRLVQ